MKKLKKVLKNREGFTLIEMLIVVAIIAILVAVSIPLISNSLEKTRHATDEANERAAKTELIIQYLAGSDAFVGEEGGKTIETETAVYYYNAATGGLELDNSEDVISPYGQHGDHSGGCLALRIDKNGWVSMRWVPAGSRAEAGQSGWNEGLCSGKDVSHS